jgi:hypothetical protein
MSTKPKAKGKRGGWVMIQVKAMSSSSSMSKKKESKQEGRRKGKKGREDRRKRVQYRKI